MLSERKEKVALRAGTTAVNIETKLFLVLAHQVVTASFATNCTHRLLDLP